MPFYNFYYELEPLGSMDVREWIEGDVITFIQIKLPPGQRGTLKLKLLYGEMQIIPYDEDQWIFGDGDVFNIDELIEIEGKKYPLRIVATNESCCYPRSFYIRVLTKFNEDLLWNKIGDAVFNAISRAFRQPTTRKTKKS